MIVCGLSAGNKNSVIHSITVKSLDEVETESRTVLLRTDLNLPIEDGGPKPTVRFERYARTVEKLSKEGARTLVLAHQGRPARKDFLSLKDHAELLSEELGIDVEFVQSFFGPTVGDAIASMDDGEVVVMENIRFLSEELQNLPPERHADDYFVQNLSRYFDLYVDDAFSAAHRSHGSLVGFNKLLESAAGPIMEKELEACGTVRDEMGSPVLVLGGEKPSDIVGMLENMIEDAEKVLLGGIPGELALIVQGHQLGAKNSWIKEHGFDSERGTLEKLLQEHGDKFVLPEDLGTESGTYQPEDVPEGEMTWDIGPETVGKFRQEIQGADSVLMKGPMGAFEEHPDGTRELVDEIAESDAYTVLGGGHTSSLVERFDHEPEEFDHVSIAGGAFVRFMSGEKLPAVEALRD